MRLFIGVNLPAEIQQALLDFQAELRFLGVNGSFKSQENFHITLEFLGELDDSMVSTLTKTLSMVASNYKPFKLNIVGLGAFPSFSRPHTLWTAVNGCLTELHRLRNDLHSELKNKGFELDERQFRPHITLVSRPKFDNINFSVVQNKKQGDFIVTEVALFESRVMRGKRVYVNLYRACLEI